MLENQRKKFRKTLIWTGCFVLFLGIVVTVIALSTKRASARELAEQLNLGEKYLSELEYEQAIAAYQKAIEIDPKCMEAYRGLVEAYIAIGAYEDAEKVIAQAEKMLLERQAAGEDVTIDLEWLQKKKNELENLIKQKQEELEALLRQQREQEAEEQLALAEQYLFSSEYNNAMKEFEELVEIIPDKLMVYFGSVDAYLHLGKNSAAATLLEDGRNAIDNGNLSWVLEGVNKSAMEGYIALAEAFEAEGYHERAVELLERVYRENGDEIIGRKLGIVEASQIEFREDYVIKWKDAEFERLIREYLGKETEDIHYDDVKEIEEIEIWGEIIRTETEKIFLRSYFVDGFQLSDGREGERSGKIRTLEDLEHFTSLKQLSINFQENLDISALTDIDKIDCLLRLKRLSLISNKINDISAVSNLSALYYINLGYNDIMDISPLAMLIELTSVTINDNKQLGSTDPLRGLRKLESADLSHIDKVNLDIFSDLPELREMHLVDIKEMDYKPLLKMKLDYLEISCDEKAFPIVCQLETLKSLRLHYWRDWNEGTQTSNMSISIEGIEKLVNLTRLDLLALNCYDISPIASLNIEELEIELPEDCDLTPLKALTKLKTIVVPSYRFGDDADSGLLEKVKELLPDVEVKNSWY